MMDSMTNKELDSPDPKLWQQESRIMRIARGAGVHPNYVGELIGWPSPMIEAAGSSAEPRPCAGVCRGFACSASCAAAPMSVLACFCRVVYLQHTSMQITQGLACQSRARAGMAGFMRRPASCM